VPHGVGFPAQGADHLREGEGGGEAGAAGHGGTPAQSKASCHWSARHQGPGANGGAKELYSTAEAHGEASINA
jgi:hypothetical protein